MIRVTLLITAAAVLAGCGSPRVSTQEVSRAAQGTGAIGQSCQQSSRVGANPALCNCIQMVADQTLSPGDQARAGAFFNDPDAAHAVRLSDTRRDDAFWARYLDFAEASESLCRAYAA